ncbi:MAG: phosphatidate cytidylyltransferase [Pirellulaceae bacterium]
MLRWRLVGATTILVPVLLLVWLDDQHHGGTPGVWLIPMAIGFIAWGCYELTELLRTREPTIPVAMVMLAAGVAAVGTIVPIIARHHATVQSIGPWGFLALSIFLSLMAVVGHEMWKYREPGVSVNRIALSLFVVFYVSVPIAALLWLRLVLPNRWGLIAIVSIILITKIADAGAFFVGRRWGQRRLAPLLSPKKTIAGAVGALATAAIAAFVFLYLAAPWITDDSSFRVGGWTSIVYGIALGVAGMFGDLAESLIKRDVQQKDSSNLIPGLGGALDVLDSLLAAAPVGYLCWAWQLL